MIKKEATEEAIGFAMKQLSKKRIV